MTSTASVWSEAGTSMGVLTDAAGIAVQPQALGYCADGRFVVITKDMLLHMYDAAGKRVDRGTVAIPGAPGSAGASTVASDGRLALAYQDGRVAIWEPSGIWG